MKEPDAGGPETVQSLLEGGMKRVGSYIVLSEIGHGSFGRVYKARHLVTEKVFALKVIPKTKVKTPYLKKLMDSEVRIMKLINHPNVIHLHEYMASATCYYMVLDYCDGGDLYRYINRKPNKCILEKDAIEIFKQIMNGFFELHKHNIIHRDVKSENIFRKDGQWMIGDFGLAKMGDETAISYVGSYEFMAPEMLRNGPKSRVNYSSKVDLWSIGCLFYEILFGETPFHYVTTPQMLEDIQFKSGDALKFNREISVSAKDLLRKLLQENPEKRLNWESFFSHPLFERSEPQLPREVPQIGKLQDLVLNQYKIHAEFVQNRMADFKKTELPEIDLENFAHEEKVDLAEEHSVDEAKVLILESIHEYTLRYVHERNKLWWIGFVVGKLNDFLVNPELIMIRDLLSHIVVGCATKTFAFFAHLHGKLKEDINLFGIPPQVLPKFLKSQPYYNFKTALFQDDPKVRKLYQETLMKLSAQIRGLHIRLIEPKPMNMNDINSQLEQGFRALAAQFSSIAKSNESKIRLFFYILVLIKSVIAMDAFFPYTSEENSGAKYDWVRFYKCVESGSVTELKDLLAVG